MISVFGGNRTSGAMGIFLLAMFVMDLQGQVPVAPSASIPATAPTTAPVTMPATVPATVPTIVPTTAPTIVPTTVPTTAPAAVPTTAPVTQPAGPLYRAEKIRLLIVTGGHDFDRKSFLDMFDQPDLIVKEISHPHAQAFFSPPQATEYDVLLWYDSYQEISEETRNNLVRLLNKGKPLILLHQSLADYQSWTESTRIFGGKYYLEAQQGHPKSTSTPDQKMNIHIVDPAHPITRFMSDFEIVGEAYNHVEVLPNVRPLITTDHPTSGKIIGWTNNYGNSPIVYFQLGHDANAFSHPAFRRLLIQSIRWATGKLPNPADEPKVLLFNGKDLDGWTVMGDPAGFTVKDGILRSESGKGGNWLRSNRQFGDFILRMEWRVAPEGNSGVFIRSAIEGNPWETGSEIQITNEHRDEMHCTGSMYGEVPAIPRPNEAAEVWHEFEIHCIGPRIKVFVDNIPVVDVDARQVPAIAGKPHSGYLGLQDSHNPSGWIEYRNIRITELPVSSK